MSYISSRERRQSHHSSRSSSEHSSSTEHSSSNQHSSSSGHSSSSQRISSSECSSSSERSPHRRSSRREEVDAPAADRRRPAARPQTERRKSSTPIVPGVRQTFWTAVQNQVDNFQQANSKVKQFLETVRRLLSERDEARAQHIAGSMARRERRTREEREERKHKRQLADERRKGREEGRAEAKRAQEAEQEARRKAAQVEAERLAFEKLGLPRGQHQPTDSATRSPDSRPEQGRRSSRPEMSPAGSHPLQSSHVTAGDMYHSTIVVQPLYYHQGPPYYHQSPPMSPRPLPPRAQQPASWSAGPAYPDYGDYYAEQSGYQPPSMNYQQSGYQLPPHYQQQDRHRGSRQH